MTRDEAFEATTDLVLRLQREGVLNYDQAVELNRSICRYGAAAAEEAHDRVWSIVREVREESGIAALGLT